MAAAEASRTLRLETLSSTSITDTLLYLQKKLLRLICSQKDVSSLDWAQGWIARESQMTRIPFDPAGRAWAGWRKQCNCSKVSSRWAMTFAGRSYSLNGFKSSQTCPTSPSPLLALCGGKRMLSIGCRFADIITLNPPVAPDGNSIDMAEATAEATAQQSPGFVRRQETASQDSRSATL